MSVVSITTLLPASNSKVEPTGIGTSFARTAVPFVTLFVPLRFAVSLTRLTVAVTCEV